MSDVIEERTGVYDTPIETYHSQKCCPGPSVSSSGLRKILHENPARFYAMSDLNPHRFPEKDKKALAFGRAAHALVLGEPEFNSKFVISPFDNFMSKDARAWRDAQTRQIVRPEEMVTINDMAAAQKASPMVTRAFTEGKAERSIFWKDAETGVWLKIRPDWLPDQPAARFITEYKTAESIKPRKLSNAVFDYGYDMQAAMMNDGVQIAFDCVPRGIAHIVQEKDPPYLVDCRLFSAEQIEFGRMQYRKALRIFAKCLDAGVWPGYTTEPTYFETPYWVSKAMESFNDDIGNASPEYSGADYLAAG